MNSKREIFSEETRKEMSVWYDNQYQLGLEEGQAGKDYSGRTFYGYYGWLDGREKNEKK